MPIKKMQLQFHCKKEIAPNVQHLHFYPIYAGESEANKESFDFIPGQFITLLLEHPDGVKRRSYSIATIPGNNGIEFAVSYVKDGIASKLLFNLKPNDTINAIGPAGKLVLKQDDIDCKRYILVGTGTGIAPYRAMLPEIKHRLDKDPDFKVDLVFGAQKRENLFYIEDFLQLANSEPRFNVHAQLSRMNSEKDNLKPHEYIGYAQSAFERLNLNPQQDIIYLCGNPDMIDDSFDILTAEGFETGKIRREKYISSN